MNIIKKMNGAILKINPLKLSKLSLHQNISHFYPLKDPNIMKKQIFSVEKIQALLDANMMIYKIFLIKEQVLIII